MLGKYRSGIQVYVNMSKETEGVDVGVSKITFLHICFLFHIIKRNPCMTVNYNTISLNEGHIS